MLPSTSRARPQSAPVQGAVVVVVGERPPGPHVQPPRPRLEGQVGVLQLLQGGRRHPQPQRQPLPPRPATARDSLKMVAVVNAKMAAIDDDKDRRTLILRLHFDLMDHVADHTSQNTRTHTRLLLM